LRWFGVNSLITAVLSLCWLILRSGTKPSRLSYPCQQAALSTAWLALAGPVAAALVHARRGIAAGLRGRGGAIAAVTAVAVTLVAHGLLTRADAIATTVLDPPPDYRAKVFHVTKAARSLSSDRFTGLDNLVELMGRRGLKFHRSSTTSLTSGPNGIIGAEDTVIIKINYQWSERGGTNVDVLRGLIRIIVDHPDTFIGEIVIAENSQFAPIDDFDRSQNNADDPSLSPHDVVDAFHQEGYAISTFGWTDIRYTEVDEYSEGDTTDGYVVYQYDSGVRGRVSYPKFQTTFGTQISLRDGIWDPVAETYDRESLKFINLPVLKSHHSTYGATACVKNYMGVVTDALGTSSHEATADGLLGALLVEIGPADLNILDCIYIHANPNRGPATHYDQATRRRELVASTDPIAADMWAVTNILIPAFESNHYSPPWPYPSADPADPTSAFREYIDNSMSQLLEAGYRVTNDLESIDTYSWDGSPWVEGSRLGVRAGRIGRSRN
jgi:hypothetical protein